MKYIEMSDATPAEYLATDEALLDLCEAGEADETLLCWESREYFVVVGYANHAAREVNLENCREAGVPALRRISGGGTVLQGPGCLNYSVVLRIEEGGPTQGITATNNFVMERQRAAIQLLVSAPVNVRGHTDLVMGDLKFSGNAQRRKKRFLIFHGTFLLNFDLRLIEKYLRMPSKEPDYRHQRGHAEFLMNLGLEAATVKAALRKVWEAEESGERLTTGKIKELAGKYLMDEWNFKF